MKSVVTVKMEEEYLASSQVEVSELEGGLGWGVVRVQGSLLLASSPLPTTLPRRALIFCLSP